MLFTEQCSVSMSEKCSDNAGHLTLASLGLPRAALQAVQRTAKGEGKSFTSKQSSVAAQQDQSLFTPQRCIRYFYLKKTKSQRHKMIEDN